MMSEELLINVTPTETRVAVVENGMLQEVYIERTQSRGIVGNIYKGKVIRVLPGMQAAFIDCGLDKAGFIHAGDVTVLNKEGMEERSKQPDNILELVRDGQEIIVQVIKDPISTKGAKLTTHLSVSSRYLVYMPHTPHIGISQKIEDIDERARLKKLVEDCASQQDEKVVGGFIVRTVAEGVTSEEFIADILFLKRLWVALSAKMGGAKVASSIYQDLPLAIRAMRDLVRPNIEKIRIDSTEVHKTAMEFANDFIPDISDRIEHYTGERPLFDLYNVEDEIKKALEQRVQLKSGGYLIIDQTEALTTIDINTGGFVGHRNLEETIFKTNLEAATAIARQLRLRNLGGMIIIDFIDMKESEHKRQVLRTLERSQEKDYAKTTITGVSELGLVEMTRKRTRESLEQILCEPCPTCRGRGMLKTAETICYEIFREILREARAYNSAGYLVLASQSVVDRLLDEDSHSVADLEEFVGAPIKFQVEAIYSQEQYDVILT